MKLQFSLKFAVVECGVCKYTNDSILTLLLLWASLMAQAVKNLPAMQEIRVSSMGQENPLQKRTANPSNIPAWRIPWTEKPDGLQSMGLQRVRQD